jgi:hypothetical protein
MRPQARPFAVEFRRKRTPQPARPASRRDEWLDTRPPDINEGSSNEPRREAERVFQRLQGSAGHATEQASVSLGIAPAAAPAHPSRVLPDLLTAAREEQRQIAEKPQRSRRAKSPPANRPTKGQPEAAPSLPIIAVAVGKNIALSFQAESVNKARRSMGGSERLPRGQRWKERRLPEVCWRR